MRHLIITIMLCSTFLSAQAQGKFYVCTKYDSEGYNILGNDSVFKEFIFNDDRSEVTIHNDTYEVADIDSIVFAPPVFPCVKIEWTEEGATVTVDPSITGVSYSIKGGHVTITSTNVKDELLYVLKGKSSDGSLILNGNYKLTMHLDSVDLTSSKGAALHIECGKRTEMKLMKGTVNSFTDRSNGTQKAALYCKGHLEIKGKGTLNVKGNTKHALGVKEYLQLKSSTGTINILGAVTDGIHCGEGSRAVADWENCRFIMNGGTVNIANCGSDCIDSDDYGSMYLNGGLIDMKVTQNDGCGLKCDSIIRMTGDTIRMEVSGTLARGIKAGYHSYFSGGVIEGTVSGPASMGIHTNKVTKTTGTVLKGGDIYFQGTDVKLDVSGVSDAGDDCYAIAIDGDYHQSDGTVDVTVSNPASYGIDIIGNYIQSGGTVHVKVNDPDAIDNGFYAGGEETITGGTKTVE